MPMNMVLIASASIGLFSFIIGLFDRKSKVKAQRKILMIERLTAAQKASIM
jgi:hypothetical protein